MEWLLQSHTGELRLLPALPGAIPEGRTRGLRARGGFEVDLVWAAGRLTEARLLAGPDGPVRVAAAADLAVVGTDGGPPALTRPAPGVVEFTAEAGGEYLLRPLG